MIFRAAICRCRNSRIWSGVICSRAVDIVRHIALFCHILSIMVIPPRRGKLIAERGVRVRDIVNGLCLTDAAVVGELPRRPFRHPSRQPPEGALSAQAVVSIGQGHGRVAAGGGEGGVVVDEFDVSHCFSFWGIQTRMFDFMQKL